MTGVAHETVGGDEEGMRLDRWFKAHYPSLGFGHLQKLLRSGQVRVDGRRARTSQRLQEGQTVRVPPVSDEPPRPPEASPGDAEALRAMIVHRDDALFVLNKPPGLAVQGGPGVTRHVDGMLPALALPDGQKPRLVHRLDRETSGLLLVARTRSSAQKLAENFRARETRKFYWALVAGVPRPHEGRISTWLGRQEGENGDLMRSYRQRQADTVHALTRYAVVEQVAQKLSWLLMQPITGRTHQLRVHAREIGHPIVGDARYFDIENWQLPGGMQNRLHLHARSLAIPHPDGGVLDISVPLPDHMRQSWSLLELDERRGTELAEQLS